MPRSATAKNKPFSEDLAEWAKSSQPKTLDSLNEVFGEKSFAVIFVILMALPATPLPTGGVSHLFEVIVMLLALELVIGLRSIWLPEAWRKRPLGDAITKKAIPYIVSKVSWVEKYSRPRLVSMTQSRLGLPVIGLVIIIFSLTAFLAPPFSGLDTLPALGVVLISLGLILEDALGLLLGAVVGAIGIGLVVGLGSALLNAVF